jgi:NAD(P)-dependent dehydrogenase (short-subunit alcohol dehydrogenase family)
LARARNFIDVLHCLRFFFRCIRDCIQPLVCELAKPKECVAEEVNVPLKALVVAVMGSATSQTAYTASKGGVVAMTREIAIEFARKGIRANALCPGPVNTPLLAPLLADLGRPMPGGSCIS